MNLFEYRSTREITMMKFIIAASFFGLVSVGNMANASKKMAVISAMSESDFDQYAKPLFLENTAGCKNCEMLKIAVVDEKSPNAEKPEVLEKKVTEALMNLPEDVKALVFDFNYRSSKEMAKWVEAIQKAQSRGVLVFANAGQPRSGDRPALVKQTLLGEMSDVLLFAETSVGERLWPNSHFGPEIFMAKRMPAALGGKNLVVYDFASRWLKVADRRSSAEWLEHFHTKKKNTKKLWLEVHDVL